MPGPVYLDPWSPYIADTCTVTDAMRNSTLGILQACHDTSVSANCYQEVGSGHIIHNKYESCTDSWLLLPGFNLLPNWFLIGASRRHTQQCSGPGDIHSTPRVIFLDFNRSEVLSKEM
jgi:hypothetical protein